MSSFFLSPLLFFFFAAMASCAAASASRIRCGQSIAPMLFATARTTASFASSSSSPPRLQRVAPRLRARALPSLPSSPLSSPPRPSTASRVPCYSSSAASPFVDDSRRWTGRRQERGGSSDVTPRRVALSSLPNRSSTGGDDEIIGARIEVDVDVGAAGDVSPFPNDDLALSRRGLNPCVNRRHAPMVYHERYSCPDWPENHTFPMSKFERTARSLLLDNDDVGAASSSSISEDDELEEAFAAVSSTTPSPLSPTSSLPLVLSPDHFYRPLEAQDLPRSWLAKPTGPIDPGFLRSFLSGTLTAEEARIIGFREQVHRPELIERTLIEVAGTVLTAQLALRYGLASNLAGGTHHARPDMGAGYTILNDLAVAANFVTSAVTMTGRRRAERVLVVDCDVHQGDGTAHFSGGNGVDNDDCALHRRLFTLSVHASSNYPNPKATSTYDVGLPDGCDDETYLAALEGALETALDEIRPDLVLYDAGVDVHESDVLGRLALTDGGMRRRDRYVLERCVDGGIPVAAVVGGGYDKDVAALGRRHAVVHRVCAEIWREKELWRGWPKRTC